MFYVLVCIADLFRVTWKLSSCVCVFNRHVVEMLRLKKGDLSPRSLVYWAFHATEALKERETVSSGNNDLSCPGIIGPFGIFHGIDPLIPYCLIANNEAK